MKFFIQLIFFGIALLLTFLALVSWFALWSDATPQGLLQVTPIDNYTEEELIFAAMHHDLGKVGDLHNDHYIPNDSDWHIKNQGKYYVNNPDLQFMTPPDRGIWILNQFGITITITLDKKISL